MEPELADAVVDDVEGEPGALPLLSTALLELWQKRQDNALAFATASPAAFTAPSRAWLRAPTLASPTTQAARARHHAAPGRRGRGRRAGAPPRSARRARPGAQRGCGRRARDAGRQPPRHRRRGLRRGRPRGAAARMAAPALWWIEEDAEGRRLHRHITEPATRPLPAGRDQGELYRGARLAAAVEWTADHELDLNELEREFVTEGREVSNRRRNGRAARTGAFAPCSPGSRSCWPRPRGRHLRRHPARRGARRGDGQLAQRLGAQALVGGPRPFPPARPPRRSRSTTHRRRAATCSPTSYAPPQ